MNYWWNRFTEDDRGFTLVELMIVVAIIGILAAIAIPQFMESVQSAKSAEAEQIMSKMVDGSVGYFTKEQQVTPNTGPEPWHSGAGDRGEPVSFQDYVYPGGTLCDLSVLADSAGGPVSPPVGGTKETPNPNGYSNCQAAIVNWHGLELEDPLYFEYQYTSTGTGNGATAQVIGFADFNDDGGTDDERHIQSLDVVDGEPNKFSAFTINKGK